MNSFRLPVMIAGSGVHVPETVITNAQLTQTFDTTEEWILTRTGIAERRRLAPELATSDMCVAAAKPALAAAGLTPADLDVIIVASYTYDQPLPSTALIVKDALGADRAMAMDVTQAACAAGIHALMVGAHLLQNPGVGAVLVIAADCASRVTDPADRTTGVFFGDAAAAVVLTETADPGAGLLAFHMGSELSYAVHLPAGGYLRMDGRAVWRAATTRLPETITSVVRRAGLEIGQIDHFFLHQANLNILTHTLATLGVPAHKAPITLDKLGNTGAAGMLTALHHTWERGLLQPGDTYVLSGIGAGFHWGSLCFRHGSPGR